MIFLAFLLFMAQPEAVSPVGGLRVVHLNETPLLRSEQRGLERLAKQLGKAGKPVRVAAAEGAAAETLKRYFDTADPTERAKLPLAEVVGGDAAVLVIRYAVAPDNIAKRPLGFALLKQTAPHEVIWVSGMGLIEESVSELVKIIKGLGP